MSLHTIEAKCLRIPFNVVFRHAAAARSETASIWVETRNHDGVTGMGESCPREYVSGETLTGALLFIETYKTSLMAAVSDLTSLKDWSARHRQEINHNPAAWCAVELALIDLFAREAGQSVEGWLDLPEIDRDFRYTAVLGDAGSKPFARQLEAYLQAGFTDYKIKISGNPEHDREKMRILEASGQRGLRVRVDGNNLWDDAKRAARYLKSLDYPFAAIEEPLVANDYAGMSIIADALGLPLILDESFLRAEQFPRIAVQGNGLWMINLRVSKMGGLLRSLEVLDHARDAGVKLVIGAQVGESSLLTRAALTVANAANGLLYAQEGAFGTHLLSCDICDPVLMFGHGGILADADKMLADHPGFGLTKQSDAGSLLSDKLPA